jgi:AraC family transcriptional regulator of adaptative response/methylated-DNA-[protein]-cysteine methyltransferase
MSNVARLDADTAWAAFMRRDRAWDGRVVGAVKTTGIYCKPSCPAKRPKREHVDFFTTSEEARAAGFRACLRCKPDEVGRDREAVAAAVRLIDEAEEAPNLAELADAVGYAPHHFQRIFKRDLGVSPAEYARGLRNRRVQDALKQNNRVTDAVYDAGYAGPSGFYSDAKERLGMTPSAWRDGDRRDEQGHLPPHVRRQRGLAAATVPEGDHRRGRRWTTRSGRRCARRDRAAASRA